MRNILNALLALFILFTIFGCEGYRCAEETIRDLQNNQALDSVLCEVITGSDKIYTDTAGTFKVCNNLGGCFLKCKDIIIRFSRAGYKTKQEENLPPGAIIFLEKE